MRLVEYLFTDPGTPPTPDHVEGDGNELFMPFDEFGVRMGGPAINVNPSIGDEIARLDGGFYNLPSPFTPEDAIRYRHVLGELGEDELDEARKMNERSRQTLLDAGVREVDLEEVGRIIFTAKAMSKGVMAGPRGKFIADAPDLRDEADIKSTQRLRSLVLRYGAVIGRYLNKKPIVWLPGGHQSSGAGPWGNRNPNMAGTGGYSGPMVTDESIDEARDVPAVAQAWLDLSALKGYGSIFDSGLRDALQTRNRAAIKEALADMVSWWDRNGEPKRANAAMIRKVRDAASESLDEAVALGKPHKIGKGGVTITITRMKKLPDWFFEWRAHEGGVEVGKGTFAAYLKGGGGEFMDSDVHQEFRGRGIYPAIIKTIQRLFGGKFESNDLGLTGSAAKAWTKAGGKQFDSGGDEKRGFSRFALGEAACGHCFEWAYQQFMQAKGKVTLHHGTVVWLGESQRKDHAWIVRGGRIFDWQMMEAGFGGKFHRKGYPKDVFEELFQPKRVKTYKNDLDAIHAQGAANKRGQGFHYGPWESLDEVLKNGVQSDSAKDRKAISQLEGDQFPSRAEDGKGFCFHWADGRGVCGFTKKSDALCWLKESPRDVVKFWYGEPVVGSKQRRFKLTGDYTPKDESIAEGVKREHGSYDNRAISKLKGGKFPGRAEDGKGFCFVCTSGAIHAFRWRNDALRWAQDQPREITKFWYGEPVSPSGKFRVRVRDRYHKDEAVVESFTTLLERRAEGVA